MERRAFILGMGASAMTPSFPEWMQNRAKIGLGDVQRVRATATHIARVDFAQGGGAAVGPAIAELNRVSEWPALAPLWLRPKMAGAVGELANTVGFAAFDHEDYATCRHCWSLALRCAETADDRPQWAHAMTSTARHLAWSGTPDQALPLVDRVLELSPQLPADVVAMTYGVKARTLASMGDVDGTLAAVGAADDAMDLAGGDRYVAYYDRATHYGNTGHALADLVTAGHPELLKQAGARIMGAIVGQTSARSVVMGQAVGATVLMAAGDPAEAVAMGETALDLALDVDSARTRSLFRRLHHVAGKHANRADVADLRHQIQQHAA